MFRGFRWQLTSLLLAFGVFCAGAAYHAVRQTPEFEPPAPSPAATWSEAAPSTVPAPAPTRSPAASPPPAPYREGLVGSVRRLNPLFAHLNPADDDIASLIFEGLFATNAYGEVEPKLAAELVISADGLEYVVRLRDDARWQDGVAFGADDVVYTLSLLSDPDYAEMSGAGAFWATIETQKLGDRLLRFRLAQPMSGFPRLLTIGILPEHALRGTTLAQMTSHPFNLSPIGTGPYQLDSLRLGARGQIRAVELARSPVYMRRLEAKGRYRLDRLRFNLYSDAEGALAAFAAGEVNALADIAPPRDALNLGASQLYAQAQASVVTLIFNWQESPFAERRLRQALALSLDVPALIQARFASAATYADSPYSPGSSIYLPHAFWTRYDLAQASALLEAAAMRPSLADTTQEADPSERGADFSRFSLLIEDSPELRGLADDIAGQWERLGFQLDLEAVGEEDLRNRLETGRFQTAVVRQNIGGNLDLYRFWHPAQYGNGLNYGAAADHDAAELLEKARREIYSDRRAALRQQFQVAFAEGALAIPLYYPIFTFIAAREIEGVQLGYLAKPADRFRGVGDWSLRPLPG